MNNDRATREQVEFSDVIVNKLIAFNKIPLSHKNIWKDELIEILVETSCHPYPNLYDEIKKYCESTDFDGHGVGILKNRLKAKIKKDKTVQGEEATQNLKEHFISLSDEAKKNIVICSLHANKGGVLNFTIPFIKKQRKEFREKVNDIRRTYRNNEEDKKKLSDMEKIFDCYSESDKLACVRSFLATVLGQIPDFYLDFIGLQSEDIKEELRMVRAELLNKKR